MSAQTQKGPQAAGFQPPPPKIAPGPLPPPLEIKSTPVAPGAKDKVSAPPSRVILLRNMVGKGEVDPELEGEIKEECTKFGPVLKVKVHQFPESTSDSDAIRIFVQFSTITSASKAVKVMNGRFFGGRIVKASPYPEGKFHKSELDDSM